MNEEIKCPVCSQQWDGKNLYCPNCDFPIFRFKELISGKPVIFDVHFKQEFENLLEKHRKIYNENLKVSSEKSLLTKQAKNQSKNKKITRSTFLLIISFEIFGVIGGAVLSSIFGKISTLHLGGLLVAIFSVIIGILAWDSELVINGIVLGPFLGQIEGFVLTIFFGKEIETASEGAIFGATCFTILLCIFYILSKQN